MNNIDKFNLLKITKPEAYLFAYNFTEKEKEIIKSSPHCIEYFVKYSKLINCSKCFTNYKLNHHIDKYIIKNTKSNTGNCNSKCYKNSILYPLLVNPIDSKYFTKNIEKFKKTELINKKKLSYKLSEIPYVIDYELSTPAIKSVTHWGQLKMLLVTLIFLIKVVKKNEKVSIVYPGSAQGDNILILCNMFPNTEWYLIDPNKFNSKLYNHKQIKEIKNELFTDDLAKYYAEKLKNTKLLFISDIRLSPDDESVVRDQEMNKKWYTILNPEYAYLKFRTPYIGTTYDYLDGEIYLQPYAPIASTESRLLIKKNTKNKQYNIKEYNGQLFYFNRILRPSYYKSIIKKHEYLDNCWDCVYFSYLIKTYLSVFDTNNKLTVEQYCNNIIKTITLTCNNKLKESTYYLKNLLHFK